jgi:hypothetical protein
MNVRVIPTNVHGVVDRVVAPTLVAAPELLRLSKTSPEGVAPRVNGALGAVYSNLTDYELSLKNVIPMKVHLALDAINGAALAVIPLATGARARGWRHWLPHAAIGGFEISMALLTKTQPPRTRVGRLAKLVGLIR